LILLIIECSSLFGIYIADNDFRRVFPCMFLWLLIGW